MLSSVPADGCGVCVARDSRCGPLGALLGVPLVVRMGTPQRGCGAPQAPLLKKLHVERQGTPQDTKKVAREAHKKWDESDLSRGTPEREAASQDPSGKSHPSELLLKRLAVLLLLMLLVALLLLPVLMLLLLLMGGASQYYCSEQLLRRLLLLHLLGAETAAAPSLVQPSTNLRVPEL